MKRIVFGVFGFFLLAVAASALPDLRRYMKMRAM